MYARVCIMPFGYSYPTGIGAEYSIPGSIRSTAKSTINKKIDAQSMPNRPPETVSEVMATVESITTGKVH